MSVSFMSKLNSSFVGAFVVVAIWNPDYAKSAFQAILQKERPVCVGKLLSLHDIADKSLIIKSARYGFVSFIFIFATYYQIFPRLKLKTIEIR